jgi:cytoskeletal protein CcmA (bactofilin family)
LSANTAKVECSLFWGIVMAWKWPGATKSANNEEWTGFIDQGVTLEGTLTVTGTFRIDGNVKGNIISEQTVILGEGAKVEGQIEGNRVVISGRFDGVIFAKGRVEIEAKGVVTGEVHSPCMVIDPGGIFDGRCHMLASSDAVSSVTIPIRAASTA